jgi:diguanylate cyclase (GGDEF)-like protein/PAS domain S-box-containing protein
MKPSPTVAAELLRLALGLGRFTWLGNLAFGCAIVLVLAHDDRLLQGLAWWVALASALLARAYLCLRLLADAALRARHGAALYAAMAVIEGSVWSAGLLVVPAPSALGALLQFVLSTVILIGTVLSFGPVRSAWFGQTVPLALGQALVLIVQPPALRDVVGLAWLLTVALSALAAYWWRRVLVENLALREQADAAAHAQEQAALELHRSRAQLRLALDAIDAGVADTNLVTGERFFSARYAELLGYRDRAAFLHAHRFSAALHPDDRARVLQARQRHLEQGAPFREEFRLRTAAHDYVWVQARGESVRDAAGRATRFVMSIVDITERREAELRLAASERRYRALVEASPSLIWTCDAAGRLTFVSARACRELYGYEPREMIGRHVAEFNAPEFGRREFVRRFAPALRGRAVFDAEAVHLSRAGERVYVVVSALPVRDEAGRIEAVYGICSDITALKRRERELNAALRNQQVIFEAAGEGIAFVRDDRIESANGALAKMLGVTRERLAGRAVGDFLARPEEWDAVRRASLEAAARGEAAIHEAMLRAPAGAGRGAWCQLTARQIGDERGATILVLTDITLLKRREELAWHQANHDELTGLPNRRLLVEHARRLLSVALRQRRQAAVLVLDLDGFKEVNDVFGHAYGDALLRRVALRLAAVLREYDVVARAGGDEFVVLLPEIEEPAVALRVAEKLVAAAREDLEAAGRSLRIHASVGVALFPDDGNDFEALLARADAAMYAAKAGGKNRFRFASEPAAGKASGTQTQGELQRPDASGDERRLH